MHRGIKHKRTLRKTRGRKQKQKKTRIRRQRGGDSASYGFGPAVSPGAPYASEVVAKSACLAAARPGEIGGYMPPGRGGLPGFGGGGRTRKGSHFKKLKKSLKNTLKKARKFARNMVRRLPYGKKVWRGGRYTVEVAQAVGGPNVFAPVLRTGCEGGLVNTSPPGAAPNPMLGGAVPLAPGPFVGTPDSAAYAAPTAGYGNQASTWVGSTGSPVLLQQPYDARSMNPACLKTGGKRTLSKK